MGVLLVTLSFAVSAELFATEQFHCGKTFVAVTEVNVSDPDQSHTRLMLRKTAVFMVEHVPAERTQRQRLAQRQRLPSGSLPTVPRAAHVVLYWKPREGGRKILVPHEQYERLI